MIAMLIVTHGDLAKALVSSAHLIMGESSLTESQGLYHGENIEGLKDKVKDSITNLHEKSEGDGVIILTDLFGGSPSNAIARALHELGDNVKAECITGVNLPILLEAANCKSYMSLDELKNHCINAGKENILCLKERLNF